MPTQNTQDKFATLRAKYQQGIGDLQRKLEVLDELESDLEEDSAKPKPVKVAPASASDYEGWKITPALLDAVKEIGTNGGVSATELCRYIEERGYKHTNKWIASTAAITLKRLAKNQQIITEKVGDSRIYKAKM
jgi:hypothetical protein